jgi:dihydropteroate synthase
MRHTKDPRNAVGVGERTLGPDPVLMGVLNVTPDSFSDGGDFLDSGKAASRAVTMLDEGAEIIDVGGESTRPGSDPVPQEEEVHRIVPVIQKIVAERPDAIVSIDTYRAATAGAALEAGARIVNDVSALRGDPRMAAVAAGARCPLILMHMLGEPKTMQSDPRYGDVVREVRDFLAARAEHAVAAGVEPENIILDPGIGFGKTLEHNLELLRRLDELAELGFPVLVGASRKSFIGRITGVEEAKGRVSGTVAANVMAYERGATFFRVHDVRANREALAVARAVRHGWLHR